MDRFMHCLQSGSLEELDIRGCKLKFQGMSVLGHALLKSKLKKLYAADNKCGDAAAIIIAESLSDRSCRLEFLDLSNNEITDKSGVKLA